MFKLGFFIDKKIGGVKIIKNRKYEMILLFTNDFRIQPHCAHNVMS